MGTYNVYSGTPNVRVEARYSQGYKKSTKLSVPVFPGARPCRRLWHRLSVWTTPHVRLGSKPQLEDSERGSGHSTRPAAAGTSARTQAGTGSHDRGRRERRSMKTSAVLRLKKKKGKKKNRDSLFCILPEKKLTF